MRWVDRGPEPEGVSQHAQRYTSGWIGFCRHRDRARPDDDHWRDFTHRLRERFNNRCGYCERKCDYYAEFGSMGPSVDHFCPRCECPELVYAWTNWIFSCQRCNYEKADHWPASGFVDPCSADVGKRPEQFFDFDTETGQIIPREDLTNAESQMALDTIQYLGLNKWDLPELRRDWTKNLRDDMSQMAVSDRQAVLYFFTDPAYEKAEFIGTTKMLAAQIGMASFTHPEG